ncbi:putative flavoprotein CzcO associated with the cation diffusion facilitator CzcD [Williamsia serinedens]|uniref:Flavoprotein CzcO associated with the cation diffusion facilitator CzcD n=1 Tax=Williamsia serinedens TaxID=391736 RepID=A0ABT1GV71_9NOCA|nr:putative flavoprotein CzcO associated with the cation diffusion facilitator CzcD [Williamsia serinedens]
MSVTDVEVVIVGAGLSGIGAAHHVREAVGDSFVVLESRRRIGGTWDLFRYPGVRCDSDMHSLSYRHHRWTDSDSIVSGDRIREYIESSARRDGTLDHIRFGHRVTGADFDSSTGRWTVTATTEDDPEPVVVRARFLYLCTGYYDHARGHEPHIPGLDDFAGPVVHPQHWPQDLDLTGKRVVVVGSGATAITVVPALAQTAAHVTMLQRSPTYVMSFPSRDAADERLARLVGRRTASAVTRVKNIAIDTALYQACRRWPDRMRGVIRKENAAQLPADFDLDRHFTPRYDPWDQRMCLAPDGDLFRALSDGSASVVTDTIDHVRPDGVVVSSGELVPADVVVTATGLQMLAFGRVTLSVDGVETPVSETLSYKGMMLSGLPNLVFTIGYTNASWTLKADLVGEHFRRLVRHMRRHGHDTFVPVAPTGVRREPLLDCRANYIVRSIDTFPRAGGRAPWQLGMNYYHDVLILRRRRVADPALRFGRIARTERAAVGTEAQVAVS